MVLLGSGLCLFCCQKSMTKLPGLLAISDVRTGVGLGQKLGWQPGRTEWRCFSGFWWGFGDVWVVFWWHQLEHYPQLALCAPLDASAWSTCRRCIKALQHVGVHFPLCFPMAASHPPSLLEIPRLAALGLMGRITIRNVLQRLNLHRCVF